MQVYSIALLRCILRRNSATTYYSDVGNSSIVSKQLLPIVRWRLTLTDPAYQEFYCCALDQLIEGGSDSALAAAPGVRSRGKSRQRGNININNTTSPEEIT
jgi:hypothetical protein